MLTFIAVLALLYACACALLFARQRSFIYHPQPAMDSTGAPTLLLPVDGAQIVVTTRPSAEAEAVIYFGGNAEDVSRSLPELVAAYPGKALYLMHYRGYGGSSGSPSEKALFADAAALFDKVHADHGRITVVGRSLGSGVATHLASVRPVARLVLVTPYNSILEIAASSFPWVPVGLLLQDRYESWRYAKDVTVPTLLIAAERDTLIPRASTEALQRAFRPGVATLRVVGGTGHNDISSRPEYTRLLAEFR